jgi:hypothetical protein
MIRRCTVVQEDALVPARGVPVLLRRQDRVEAGLRRGHHLQLQPDAAAPVYAIAYITLKEGPTMSNT